jgi:hypothetical protein
MFLQVQGNILKTLDDGQRGFMESVLVCFFSLLFPLFPPFVVRLRFLIKLNIISYSAI